MFIEKAINMNKHYTGTSCACRDSHELILIRT